MLGEVSRHSRESWNLAPWDSPKTWFVTVCQFWQIARRRSSDSQFGSTISFQKPRVGCFSLRPQGGRSLDEREKETSRLDVCLAFAFVSLRDSWETVETEKVRNSCWNRIQCSARTANESPRWGLECVRRGRIFVAAWHAALDRERSNLQSKFFCECHLFSPFRWVQVLLSQKRRLAKRNDH